MCPEYLETEKNEDTENEEEDSYSDDSDESEDWEETTRNALSDYMRIFLNFLYKI